MNNDQQILELYNQGLSFRQIAKQLNLSYSTVNYRCTKVLKLEPRKISGWKLSDETKSKLSDLAKVREQHPMQGKKHPEESKAKMSKSARGINKRAHLPEWDGSRSGESNKFYNSATWKEIQKLVFLRDNHTCVLTGKHGGNLECHHIIPRQEDSDLWYDIDNLITLSKQSHRNLHAQEKKFGKQILIRNSLLVIAQERTH